jgi:DNA-binding CsgD family transcriptional regulator/tetratricopeptide (TPR) repeat protein
MGRVVAAGLERARDDYARGRWDLAHAAFAEASTAGTLDLDDLAAQADAAWWLGRTDESLALSEEVYRRCLQGEQTATAGRLAVEIGFLWLLRGEETIGSGWISRAHRLLDDAPERAEHGYLRYLDVLAALDAADFGTAMERAHEMEALARRHDDATLAAIAIVLEGVATVRSGEVARGLAMCDEAMLPVRAGAVTPNWAGNLYCQVMGLCFELADFDRARAWTDATERWCDQFSNAAMFTGICRVHRAQLLHLEGAWDQAEVRALQACRDLDDMNVGVVAAGHYEIGELRRLRGDHEAAASAYARAHELGRDPQPGWALLRLAQGDVTAARAALDTALAAAEQPLTRAPSLTALLDVAEFTGDRELATSTAAELRAIAAEFPTPGLLAQADQAEGVAHLLHGAPGRALRSLLGACRRWRALEARYEVARTQLRVARALEGNGDAEGAGRERRQAAATLAALGAPDGAGGRPGRVGSPEPAPGGLTPREVEVLRAVADGATNATVAEQLTISERTVERHLSNVYLKLQVSSRTEAVRFAFAHGLADLRDR